MVKNPPANAGDVGCLPGSGRFPGGGNGNPLQYSCLRRPTDRGAWRATVHGLAKELDMNSKLNDNTCATRNRVRGIECTSFFPFLHAHGGDFHTCYISPDSL